MVDLPGKDEHRVAWGALPMADRRRIMRTVTRGVAVEDRKDALLAIGAAEQQKNFWKWTWGLGPLLGLVLFDQGWQVVLLNVLLSTGLIIALSRWRWVRADRCQRANMELLEAPKRRKKPPKQRRGHLPTDDGDAPARPAAPHPTHADWSGDGPDPNTSKAKLRRRRKRR